MPSSMVPCATVLHQSSPGKGDGAQRGGSHLCGKGLGVGFVRAELESWFQHSLGMPGLCFNRIIIIKMSYLFLISRVGHHKDHTQASLGDRIL